MAKLRVLSGREVCSILEIRLEFQGLPQIVCDPNNMPGGEQSGRGCREINKRKTRGRETAGKNNF